MNSPKLNEKIDLSGVLKIYEVYPSGAKYLAYHDENIITLNSKKVLLSTIYAPAITSDPVTSLHVGTGGTIDPAGLFPKLEDQTQTNLITPLLTVATSHTENLAVPSTTFLADLDTGTGNGSLITEAGLFTTGGNMFNVKNFPGIPKTSEFSLHFEWTIKIA